MLSGVAMAEFRAPGLVPRWLAWVSVVLAVIGLVPPVSYILTLGIAVWSIIVGVLALRGRTVAAA